MRSPSAPPQRARRPRRRAPLALLLGTALLGAVAQPGASAQEPAPSSALEQFGGFDLEARTTGIQVLYNIEGLVPGGAPVLQLGLPEALTRLASGPTGYGLASLAYPGILLASMGTLIEQGGGPPGAVPPYPIQQEANFPAGPTSAEEATPAGTTMKVDASEAATTALAHHSQLAAPPVVTVGSMTSSSQTAVEAGAVVSRARSELGDISIMGGVITIESVVTDIISAHDGDAGATDGGTTVSGVRLLGLAASLDERGLILQEAPPSPSDSPADPLGGALGPAADPLAQAIDPVAAALRDVLDQATPQADELLAQAGFTIRVLQPSEVIEPGAAASREAGGLEIEFTYEGREQEELEDLIDAVPAELRPSLGPLPNPVSLLVENHITGFSLAPASVTSLATPPFVLPPLAPLPPLPDIPAASGALDTGALAAPAFESEVPEIPASGGTAAGALATDPIANLLGGALPAVLALLVVLGAPLFGAGSSRLADNVLAAGVAGCPDGLDQPPGGSP